MFRKRESPVRRVTLIGKPGCHLCDDARGVIQGVLAGLEGTRGAPVVEFAEVNLLEDAELTAKYSEDIPVVLIDDEVHDFWRVDADRFRSALTGAKR
ncbi:glutaredoxin family protein [Agromyces seonyuensis]|uniref:Glutaredoxin family protein n=1 Tax=Agromyces seonyuensis TaxID=2662446 RepID=A0A6I4P004_9MICO|nr:glutaredoxin family protein [Agromyces seonyuensis]